MGIARNPTSQDDMTRNLPKDTNMNRSNKPAQTPVGGAEMAKPAFNRQPQRELTTAAEVGRKLSDLTERSLYPGGAVEAEGAVTGATLSTAHRCRDCGIQIVAGRNSVTDEGREVRPSRTCQVIPKTAPLADIRERQYRLNSPAIVGSTDLEVPVLRMPNVFLKLAEEARESVIVDDQLTDRKEVQPHRTGQARPVFVTEIMNSIPVVGGRLSRITNPSTELTPHRNLAHPTIESDPVGPHSIPEQSVSDSMQTMGSTIPTTECTLGLRCSVLSQLLTGRRARIENAARWAQMRCTQHRMTSGRRLVARWAGALFRVLWNIEKYHPRTIRISRYLRARWARMR